MPYPAYLRIFSEGETVLLAPVRLKDGVAASEVHEFTHQVTYIDTDAWTGRVSRHHSPIILLKPIDQSTVLLMDALRTGRRFPRAEIFWYGFDEKSRSESVYFKHLLEDVKIAAIEHRMPDTKDPAFERYGHLEQLELRYRFVTWEFCRGTISFRDQWELAHLEEFHAGGLSDRELEQLLAGPALTDALFEPKPVRAAVTPREPAAETQSDDKKEPVLQEIDGWWLSCMPVKPGEGVATDGPTVSMIEMEDTLFRHDSTVLLPEEIRAGEAVAGTESGCEGLEMIAQILMHLNERPAPYFCLIAGHTDTTGNAGYNTKLSLLRSRAVRYVLRGLALDRESWGEQFREEYLNAVHTRTVKDLQQILGWTARVRGWPCDPGPVDGVAGEKTTVAIRSFQKSYNGDPAFGPDITVDGVAKKQTWMAIFDVYQAQLASLLGTDRAQLDTRYRNGIDWNGSVACAGCGERWPIEEKNRDNYRSQTNRRVEALVFDQDEAPVMTCTTGGCAGNACPVYSTLPDGSPRFSVSRVYVDRSPVPAREGIDGFGSGA